ncbi:MAG: Gfo/Idh/MocA family protein [Pirellulaceae bacterium]
MPEHLSDDDYRKLLEMKDLQAVIVATNKHWHALPTIHACQAGKDVYIEKPLAHSIGEGRAMVQAAEKYNRIVQVGTQQHSSPHYQQAVEIIRSGELGDISEVKVWDYENQYPGWGAPADCEPPAGLDWDFWLGPAPKVPYNPNYFLHDYWFFDYAGSFQCDWAVHHYDIVHWAMGVDRPKSVVALGGMMCFPENNLQYPDTLNAVLEYPPGPVSKQGFLMQYTFRGGSRREHRSHGKCFFGTKASLIVDRGGYTIIPEDAIDDKSKHVTVDGTDDTHVEVFLECVRSRTKPVADVEVGHHATIPGHLINIAWRSGHKIQWDAEKRKSWTIRRPTPWSTKNTGHRGNLMSSGVTRILSPARARSLAGMQRFRPDFNLPDGLFLEKRTDDRPDEKCGCLRSHTSCLCHRYLACRRTFGEA